MYPTDRCLSDAKPGCAGAAGICAAGLPVEDSGHQMALSIGWCLQILLLDHEHCPTGTESSPTPPISLTHLATAHMSWTNTAAIGSVVLHAQKIACQQAAPLFTQGSDFRGEALA